MQGRNHHLKLERRPGQTAASKPFLLPLLSSFSGSLRNMLNSTSCDQQTVRVAPTLCFPFFNELFVPQRIFFLCHGCFIYLKTFK